MNKRNVTLNLLCFIVCMLIFTGCDKKSDETDKAMQAAEELKAELANAENLLEKTRNERDDLKGDLAIINENWDMTKAELVSAMLRSNELERKAQKLTGELNSAVSDAQVARSETRSFSEQLREAIANNQGYEQLFNEMQAEIEQLQLKVAELTEVPAQEDENEPIEVEMTEEVTEEVTEEEITEE